MNYFTRNGMNFLGKLGTCQREDKFVGSYWGGGGIKASVLF